MAPLQHLTWLCTPLVCPYLMKVVPCTEAAVNDFVRRYRCERKCSWGQAAFGHFTQEDRVRRRNTGGITKTGIVTFLRSISFRLFSSALYRDLQTWPRGYRFKNMTRFCLKNQAVKIHDVSRSYPNGLTDFWVTSSRYLFTERMLRVCKWRLETDYFLDLCPQMDPDTNTYTYSCSVQILPTVYGVTKGERMYVPSKTVEICVKCYARILEALVEMVTTTPKAGWWHWRRPGKIRHIIRIRVCI